MNPSESALSPSASLVQNLCDELRRFAPFAQMDVDDVEAFVRLARQTYYAPGETLLQPGDGPVARLLFLRRGSVAGGPPSAGFHLETGDLFPTAAWLARRAVSAPYVAIDDCFCLEVPADAMHELAARSALLADFLHRRVQHVLALSNQAQQAAFAAQALSEQSMAARLGSLPRRALVSCAPQASLLQALQLMQQKRVGSVLVLDEAGAARGIFTRHDLLERVALAQPPMATPIAELMTQPVRTLDAAHSVQDAALLMLRHGLRHVPVTESGRVVAMVSERDLFVLQRLSLRHIGDRLREAADLQALVATAPDIRHLAHALLAQGLSARALTEMISHLNDLLTERAVQLVAEQQGQDLRRACWLAFGSEGRSEQTIATDQDNGLVLSPAAMPDRARWLAFGDAVNRALAAAGYPLCKGGIMAGQEACCLGADEWQARFDHWIAHGAPEDLLAASIYFDLRPLAGSTALVGPLVDSIATQASATPRFLKQMADNLLAQRPPLAWHGGIAGNEIDLKLQGTAIFVGGARLLALAAGVRATGTHARLQSAGAKLGIAQQDTAAWIGGFEYLQTLRLAAQVAADGAEPGNRVEVAKLNDIDRRVLREALHAARRLQQRIELDYP